MESKQKKKIAIIVSIVSLVLVCAIVGTILIFNAINNKKNKSENSASNVNYSTEIDKKLFEAHKAILNNHVSADYSGTYEFKTVSSIIFNPELTAEQITAICEKQGTTDPNGLQKMFLDAKHDEVDKNKELITLNTKQGYGSYSKTHNGNTVVEFGKYFGNNDLSEIRLYDDASGKYIAEYDMSLTHIKEANINASSSSDNTNNDLLYIYKKVYSSSNEKLVLFTITYVYELLPPAPPISDSDLNFDI